MNSQRSQFEFRVIPIRCEQQRAAAINEFVELRLFLIVRISIRRSQDKARTIFGHHQQRIAFDAGKKLAERSIKSQFAIQRRAVRIRRRSVFARQPPKLQDHKQSRCQTPEGVRLQQSAFLLHGRLPENMSDTVQTFPPLDFVVQSTQVQIESQSLNIRHVCPGVARRNARNRDS